MGHFISWSLREFLFQQEKLQEEIPSHMNNRFDDRGLHGMHHFGRIVNDMELGPR